MRERGIIMTEPNPALIRAGRKHQTRRLVRGSSEFVQFWRKFDKDDGPRYVFRTATSAVDKRCPYGDPGDRLWIREKWNCGGQPRAGRRVEVGYPGVRRPDGSIELQKYKAVTLENDEQIEQWERFKNRTWVPSIFMPRWASRTITALLKVRVERLQDITEEDALAEGIDDLYLVQAKMPTGSRVYCYRLLFESLHGEGSWAENPFVWVLDIEKI